MPAHTKEGIEMWNTMKTGTSVQYVKRIEVGKIRKLPGHDNCWTRHFLFTDQHGNEHEVTAFCDSYGAAICDFEEDESLEAAEITISGGE